MKTKQQNHDKSVNASSAFQILSFLRWTLTLVFLGFAIYMFAQVLLNDRERSSTHQKLEEKATSNLKPQPTKEEVIRDIINKQNETIKACHERDEKSIEYSIAQLNAYFDQKIDRIDAFNDEIFSLKSKAKMAYYYIKNGGSLENYLEKMTEKYLGSPQDLESKLNMVTSSLKTDLKRNHNQLVLATEADLRKVPYALNISENYADSLINNFTISFNDTLAGMLPKTVGAQLGVESASFAIDAWVAPMIARGIVGFVASRGIVATGTVAAEGAAVATGASLGPYTAGVSIVIGTIIAIGIDYACNKVAKADAREKVVESLRTWRETTIANYSGIRTSISEFQIARMQAMQKVLSDEIHKVAYADRNTTSSQIAAMNSPSLTVNANKEVWK